MRLRNLFASKLVFGFFIAICSVFQAGNTFAGTTPTQYKFGVFPFMPMQALIKYYNSVSMDLTHFVHKRIIAQSRPTFKLFTEELVKETYDIIFIQPFDYPLAYDHNYRPLARREDDLDMIIVTRIDSKIKSIKDLEGKILANPPSESAITTVLSKVLKDSDLSGENKIKMIYTSNHFACMQMVLVGKADACSTTSPVLIHWEKSQLKTKKLHVIFKSGTVPHTLYMAHSRVPKEDQEKIKHAILTWNKRPEGKMILKIFSVSAFVEAKDSDYDVIRHFWDN